MKISIITATYNSEKTLKNTIESVLRQSYKDIEYIVVDGASKDHTLDIVHSYESQFDGKLKYISEKDNGLYDAMNKGIALATGEIIGILNSDDFYTSDDILEQIVKRFSEENVDAVYGDVHYVDDRDLSTCVRYYSSKVFKRSLMRLGFMPAHPSFYCRQEIYKQCGRFDTSYKVAADYEQLLRIIFINNARIAYIPRDFVTMRIGGISNNNLNSRMTIMKEHHRALKGHGIKSCYLLLFLRYLYKIHEILKSPTLYKESKKARE